MIYATLQPNDAMIHYEQCHVLRSFPASNPATLLKIQDSNFCSNHFSAAIYIEGFYWHRAAFEGGNEIANNIGIGVVLNDTLLEVHGCNGIRCWWFAYDIRLSPTGKWLGPECDSQFSQSWWGIHISYSGREAASYEDFLH